MRRCQVALVTGLLAVSAILSLEIRPASAQFYGPSRECIYQVYSPPQVWGPNSGPSTFVALTPFPVLGPPAFDEDARYQVGSFFVWSYFFTTPPATSVISAVNKTTASLNTGGYLKFTWLCGG